MRILSGTVDKLVDVTTTTNLLSQVALSEPEILPHVLNLFEGNLSTVGSFLARKGLTKHGLYADMKGESFKVVGNRQVKWKLDGPTLRKGVIQSHNGGSTPGLNHTTFTLSVNTDFFSKNNNLELADRRTILHVLSKEPASQGVWNYRVKLVHNNSAAYVDPTLLTAGMEIGFGHTMFPELSEDGDEKYTFDEWHTEFLGIQRMKHTISGSANATKIALEHNGVRLWAYEQDMKMYRRWAEAIEHQMLFAKATFDAQGLVHIQDDAGRDLPMGNGLLEQGDPSLQLQYNNLTIGQIEKIMGDMQLLTGQDGVTELMLCGGQHFLANFNRLMRDVVQQNPTDLVVSNGDGMGIRTAFSWYEFNGVRIHIVRCPAFDNPHRPTEYDQNGENLNSHRAFFVSLGNTIGGDPNVQLIALGNGENDRRFVSRVINGMTGNGPVVEGSGESHKYQLASSPVDGKQVHILTESGIVMRNPMGFAQMFKARRR